MCREGAASGYQVDAEDLHDIDELGGSRLSSGVSGYSMWDERAWVDE